MDAPSSNLLPNAAGMVDCLKALAQEAASLDLFRTLAAIEDALDAAVRGTGMDTLEDATFGDTKSPVLH